MAESDILTLLKEQKSFALFRMPNGTEVYLCMQNDGGFSRLESVLELPQRSNTSYVRVTLPWQLFVGSKLEWVTAMVSNRKLQSAMEIPAAINPFTSSVSGNT